MGVTVGGDGWGLIRLGKASSLSNEHRGQIPYGEKFDRVVDVVDVMVPRSSIHYRLNGFGIWPPKETLAGLVMRKGYPQVEQIVRWVRYKGDFGVVYRLYIERL